VTETRSAEPRGSGPGRSGGTSPGLFYRQVMGELRKVVWPTRDQLVTYFFVVLAFVLFMITVVSLMDLAFGSLVFKVFG
jgi:preprotein translocase subunit SecE